MNVCISGKPSGFPKYTPTYYDPYSKDSQKGAPMFWKRPLLVSQFDRQRPLELDSERERTGHTTEAMVETPCKGVMHRIMCGYTGIRHGVHSRATRLYIRSFDHGSHDSWRKLRQEFGQPFPDILACTWRSVYLHVFWFLTPSCFIAFLIVGSYSHRHCPWCAVAPSSMVKGTVSSAPVASHAPNYRSKPAIETN